MCNSIISVQILGPDVFSVENSLYLTVANIIRAEIVNENNCLKNETTFRRVAWQTTFTARKRTLKPTHPPLACLPKRGVDIAYFEQVVANVTMKMFRLPLRYRINESPISSSTPGKSLINTDFVCPNFPLHVMQKMSRQTTVRPAPWKVDGCKKPFPSGPYANTLLTIVLQSYPQYIAF